MNNQLERMLVSLFTQASYKHPASIAAQGIWLGRLFQEGVAAHKIDPNLSIADLQAVLKDEPARDRVIGRIERAANHAHRHVTVTFEPERAERIINKVLEVAHAASFLDMPVLDALLEMHTIYVQLRPFVSTNAKLNDANPEIQYGKELMKAIVRREFPANMQEDALALLDIGLFQIMVELYLDISFAEFTKVILDCRLAGGAKSVI